MKKRYKTLILLTILAISLASFVYLNAGNSDFALFNFGDDLKSFNVAPSELPDVEAVKNTLIFMKELILFDL